MKLINGEFEKRLQVSRGDRHLSYGIRYPQAPVPMTTS